MRKSLTLSLAATASLLTASAFAFGPTIAGVPDVYIAKNSTVTSGAGVEALNNVYRYENAFVIKDYVTPGVSSGNGSTSATLYWGYGIRATVGSGAYYASSDPASSILYKIGSPAGSAIAPIQINAAENTATTRSLAWKNEINITNAANLKQMSAFGRLSFYNVALSPLPSVSAGSDPLTSLTTALGATRQASLYVTDQSTTPGLASFLVTTVGLNTFVDTLSGGGAVCATEVNYATTGTFGSFILGTEWGSATAITLDGPTLAPFIQVNNTGTALELTTQVSASGTPTGSGLYAQYGGPAVPVTTGKVYRLKASLTTVNTSGSVANPTVIVRLNDATGQNAYYATIGGTFSALTGSTLKCATAYLWPIASGNPGAQIVVFDNDATQGGKITAQNIRVDSFIPANLIGSSVLYDGGTGAASTFTVGSGSGTWSSGAIQNFATGTSTANFTYAPATNGSSTTLSIGTGSSASSSIQGLAGWNGSALYTPGSGKLVVVATTVQTANPSNKYPKLWIVANGSLPAPNFASTGVLFQSNVDTGGSGPIPASPGLTVNHVYDSYGTGTNSLALQAFASVSSGSVTLNGDLTVTRVKVTSYTNPTCPCP